MDSDQDPVPSLGWRIRWAREQKGLDQAGLAELIGVSRQLVSKWENDRSIPDLVEGARIAAVLGQSFGWLAGVPVRNRCIAP